MRLCNKNGKIWGRCLVTSVTIQATPKEIILLDCKGLNKFEIDVMDHL